MRKTILFLAFVISLTINAQHKYLKSDTISEVVVTGTNNATKRNLLPYSISTISHDQIEATGHTQLLSALTGRIPSLFVSERNVFGFGVSTGGSGAIKIRGVGNAPTSQVLMMIDGKPQFSGVFSHPVADNYEAEYIDHVEIVRDPASVLYGSNAMGGAINVITRKSFTNGVHTTLSSQFGSYNTWQNAITNMTRFGKFSSLVSLGYDRTDGTQKNFDFKQGSGYVKLGYDFSNKWNIYADYSLMNFVGNDPIYAKLSNPESTDIYHQDVTRGEASVVLGDYYDNTNGALRLYFSHGNHHVRDPKSFKSLDNRFGVLVYQNYQPWKNTNLTLGFDFDHYTGKIPLSGGITHDEAVAKHMPTTLGNKEITEYAPYFTASQGLWDNFVVLNGGLRFVNSNMFGSQWIPQGGFVLNPGYGWNIKASISKGYRNPSFKELYLYKMANEDLQPERMLTYEVSIGKQFSRYFGFELTGYISRGSNIIQTLNMKNVNTGKFHNKGVELTMTSHPLDNLMLRSSYSYLHTDLDNLTAAPRHQYYLGADWTVVPQFIVNAELMGVTDLYVGENVKDQNYALLNMKLTYRLNKHIDIFASGNNLTDASYMINKGYEMPGITVNGGFKLHF